MATRRVTVYAHRRSGDDNGCRGCAFDNRECSLPGDPDESSCAANRKDTPLGIIVRIRTDQRIHEEMFMVKGSQLIGGEE